MKPMIINIALLLIVALGLIYLSGVIYAASFADRMIFPYVPSSYLDGPETFKLKTATAQSLPQRIWKHPHRSA
ncbi:MAG: hypothetical protein ACI9FZ_000470 [Bacteroidia bacterium]|jgi:hypothetical protein